MGEFRPHREACTTGPHYVEIRAPRQFSNKEKQQMKPLRTVKAVLFVGVFFFSGGVDLNNVALAQGSQTFSNPTIEGRRLDWCLHWGTQCGKPAADAWCVRKMGKADGYARSWQQAVDIGASSPTYVIGDGKVCNQRYCDGFRSIACGFSLD